MVLDCFQCTNQKWINYILEQWLEKKQLFKAVCDTRGPKSCLKLGQRAKKNQLGTKSSLFHWWFLNAQKCIMLKNTRVQLWHFPNFHGKFTKTRTAWAMPTVKNFRFLMILTKCQIVLPKKLDLTVWIQNGKISIKTWDSFRI